MLAQVKCLEGKGEGYLTFMRACMRVRVCVCMCVYACMHVCVCTWCVIAPVELADFIDINDRRKGRNELCLLSSGNCMVNMKTVTNME